MTPTRAINTMNQSLEIAHQWALRRAERTVVVVDMVESVRLMQLAEEDTVARWHWFVEQAAAALPAVGAHWIKSLGDGIQIIRLSRVAQLLQLLL